MTGDARPDTPAWDPARVFWVLALVFGAGLALLSPPLTAPDEGRHFARIHLTAEGTIGIPAPDSGASIPRSAVKLFQEVNALWPQQKPGVRASPDVLLRLLGRPLDAEERAPVQNLAHYGPVAYAPQALGVAIGRVFGLSPAALVYLGRIGNLLAWIALITAAIRITPLRRWAFCVLGLMPMHLYLSATLSADPMTNGLTLLFVAWVLRIGFGPEPAEPLRSAAILCLIAALLGLTKLGYWSLVAVVLVVPATRVGGIGRHAALFAALCVCTLLPSLLWSAHARAFGFSSPGPGIDPAAQLQAVLSDPLGFAGVLWTTFTENGSAYLRTFVGVLGRLDVLLPWPVAPAYIAVLVAAAAFGDDDPPALDAARRGLLLLLWLGTLVLLFVIFYAVANAVGDPLIRAVQGRYFISLAPLLLLAIPARRRGLDLDAHPGWWLALGSVVLGIALGANTLHYFSF